MQLTPQNIQDGLIGGAIIVALLLASHFGSRRRRYVIDEHGERQRVIAWNRGQPVYDPKTWQQRIHEEAILRRQRRMRLIGLGPFCLGPAYAGYWLFENSVAGTFLFGAPMLFMAFAIGVRYFIPDLFAEIAYQLGYQGMQGAKVLDRQPRVQPGREVVETQKAHGDARLASESEALSALNSRK